MIQIHLKIVSARFCRKILGMAMGLPVFLMLALSASPVFSQVIPDVDALRAQAGGRAAEQNLRGGPQRSEGSYPYDRGRAVSGAQSGKSAQAGDGMQDLLEDQDKLLKKYGFSYLDPDKDMVRLSFREIPLKEALQFISLQTGINLFLDTDIRAEKPVTLFIENLSLRSILDNLILANGLSRKVVSEDTYLVFPIRKEREYMELTPEVFALKYEDAKELLKILKTKDNYVFLADRTNSVIVYDTDSNLAQIRKIVESIDKARPQLEIQLELLEVERKKLREYGIKLADLEGDPGVSLQTFVDSLNHSTLNVGSPKLKLIKELSTTKILASPKIRLVDHPSQGKPGQATIQIGGKEPIRIYTTSGTGATGQTSSLEAQYTTSIQWQDTGVKMIVTAEKIHSNTEATVKIEMEVTSITSYTTEGYPRVRTKTATSTLRLFDGETVVMGGLINNEVKKVLSKVPLLGDLPVVGRLFQRNDSKIEETEIVMLVTPRIMDDTFSNSNDSATINRYTHAARDVMGGPEGVIRNHAQRENFKFDSGAVDPAPEAEFPSSQLSHPYQSIQPNVIPEKSSESGMDSGNESKHESERSRARKAFDELRRKYAAETVDS
jgi:type II secretory pathway component GspD/PulD (secretin)